MAVVSSALQTSVSASTPEMTWTNKYICRSLKRKTAFLLILTLQSLEGTVLLEFRFVKLSMQCWNFFLTKAPSSQLHSEYGKPIHLHRYSGSLEDGVLWLWAVLKTGRQVVFIKSRWQNVTGETQTFKKKDLQGKSEDPDIFPTLVAGNNAILFNFMFNVQRYIKKKETYDCRTSLQITRSTTWNCLVNSVVSSCWQLWNSMSSGEAFFNLQTRSE